MNVLSLFDGISCARVALDRAGIPVETYHACEIDKHAIAVSQKNYPDIIRLGDVRTATLPPSVDLLIGGSPCQDLSIAKKNRQGLDGDRSGLFWEYVRIWKETQPLFFILENVASMPKKDRDIITETLGVEPVEFNASLVSAQSRKRLFWTNIKFDLPEDHGIVLKDILQPDAEVDESMTMKGKAFCLTASYHKVGTGEKETEHNRQKKQRTMVFAGYVEGGVRKGMEGQEHLSRAHRNPNRVYDPDGKAPTLSASETSGRNLIKVGHIGNGPSQGNRVYSPEGKSVTLSALGGGGGAKTGLYDVGHIRKLTPIECERLQGLPDDYTEGVPKTHRYKCVGNAFHVEVVAHIFRAMM